MRFNAELNLGHVGIAISVAVTAALSVMTIKEDLRAAITKVESAVSDVKSENKLQDQRLDLLTRDLTKSQTDDVAFRTEVRQSLTTLSSDLSKLIADVRVMSATTSASNGWRRLGIRAAPRAI